MAFWFSMLFNKNKEKDFNKVQKKKTLLSFTVELEWKSSTLTVQSIIDSCIDRNAYGILIQYLKGAQSIVSNIYIQEN